MASSSQPIYVYVTILRDDITMWLAWMQMVAQRYPDAIVVPIDSLHVGVTLRNHVWHPMDVVFWNSLAEVEETIANWRIIEGAK